MVGKFGARGHPETPSRLPVYPFSHYSNVPFKIRLERGQFSGVRLSSPSSRRRGGEDSSPPAPSPAPQPPPRVSGPRDHGRRMADVRVSAASLTETVKGQEQCLGRPPAPPKPSPGGPGLLTGPLLMAMAKPPTSWGVGRSCAVPCPTRGLLPPPEGSSLPVATPDFLGCAPSPKTARFQIDPSPCIQLGKLRLKEKGLAQDPSNS